MLYFKYRLSEVFCVFISLMAELPVQWLLKTFESPVWAHHNIPLSLLGCIFVQEPVEEPRHLFIFKCYLSDYNCPGLV